MKIKRSDIVILVLIFPYFYVDAISGNTLGHIVTRGIFYVGVVYLILKFLNKDFSVCPIVFIQLAYYVAQLYSTYVNGGNYLVDILGLKESMVFILLLHNLLRRRNFDCEKVLIWWFTVLLLMNFISIFAIGVGGDKWGSYEIKYLLGYKYTFSGISVLLLMLIRNSKKKYKRMYPIIIALVLGSAILGGSSNLLAAVLLFIGLGIIYDYRWWIRRYINALNLLLVAIILNIGIVLFGWQKYLGFIIEGILHKDLSFTGRTTIWKATINEFLSSNIWIGKGNSLAFGYDGWGNLGWIEQKYSVHNQFLAYLTNGGIICLTLEVVLLIYTAYKIMKLNSGLIKWTCSVTLFCFVIMMISNSIIPYRYFELFCLLIYQYSYRSVGERRIKKYVNRCV